MKVCNENVMQERVDIIVSDLSDLLLTLLHDKESCKGYRVRLDVEIDETELHHGLPSTETYDFISSDSWSPEER